MYCDCRHWYDFCCQLHEYVKIAKTLGSTSIRYRSDAKLSDRCVIDVDPMVFAIWAKTPKSIELSWRKCTMSCIFNISPQSATYTCPWIRSALVQIMACRLFGARPISKRMPGYCQLDSSGQTSVKLKSKYKTLQSHENVFQNVVWEVAAILFRGGGGGVS